jgi:hypothetical protein
MDKIINGHTPNYLSDLVQPYAGNVHNYNLHQQISNLVIMMVVSITFNLK